MLLRRHAGCAATTTSARLCGGDILQRRGVLVRPRVLRTPQATQTSETSTSEPSTSAASAARIRALLADTLTDAERATMGSGPCCELPPNWDPVTLQPRIEEEDEQATPGPASQSEALAQAASLRPLRPFFLVLYLGLSILAMIAGYVMHPFLLKVTADFWGIKPSVDDFESSFFGLLSIVYSVFAGQTFLFLFERQINIVQELYGEVFALELLVQQTFLVCHCPDLKAAMAVSVRRYMRDEVYTPDDMDSPFSKGNPYMSILAILNQMKGQGVVVTSLVDSCKQLADAQSRRSAMAAQILPSVHWVFMHGMELIFIVTFLVFDASELDVNAQDGLDSVPEERRLFFGALFGLLALTTQVLKDLDDPLSGLYAFRNALDARTAFLNSMLHDLETRPPTYVPSSVALLETLGLIDSHKAEQQRLAMQAQGLGGDDGSSNGNGNGNGNGSSSNGNGNGHVAAPPSSCLLKVPKTGGRRRRGRVPQKTAKWGVSFDGGKSHH